MCESSAFVDYEHVVPEGAVQVWFAADGRAECRFLPLGAMQVSERRSLYLGFRGSLAYHRGSKGAVAYSIVVQCPVHNLPWLGSFLG